MGIEKEFPGLLKEDELIALGGTPIKGMNYFELYNKEKTKAGIYEPEYGREKDVDDGRVKIQRVKNYSLRRVVDKS
jgi:hypothetical protein